MSTAATQDVRRNGGAAKARQLDDLASARLVLSVGRGNPRPEPDILKRLPSPWSDALETVTDMGLGGIDHWLRVERVRDPERAESHVEAWKQALADPGDGPSTKRPRGQLDLAILGSKAFSEARYAREYLVNRVLVKRRPCVMGGPQKSLKTTFAVELMIALATGGYFLGEFAVPRRTRVLLISGESGEGVIQEIMRRVCRSKDLEPAELEGFAFWGFTLPQLANPEHLDALAEFIESNGIEVVIIDPLYLCLLTGGSKIDPANLFEVGPLLKTISDLCLGAGSTPVLLHHFRKNRAEPYGPPDMEDLAFAGIQEFARQWILLSRRERYEPGSGEHRMWLAVGGSDGHSGEWAVDVQEGVLGDDFSDRDWRVTVARSQEARSTAKQEEAERKAQALAARQAETEARHLDTVTKNARKVLAFLMSKPGQPQTKNMIRENTAISGESLTKALVCLSDRRCIETAPATVRTGKATREVDGFRPTGTPLDRPADDSEEASDV